MKKSILFIVLTFLVSWLMAGLFYFLGGKWYTPSSLAMAGFYMFVPTIAVIIVQKLIYREPVIKPLGISFRLNRWFLVAWLLPLIIALAAFGISLLMPGVEYSSNMEGMLERFRGTLNPEQIRQMQQQAAISPVHPFWLALIQGLIAGVTVNAIAGFGEELGWRGLLQREWAGLGFWKSSALIGAVWGLWHAPLILQGHNYPQHRLTGVFMMTLWCVLLAPIFSYVRVRAKSVIAAAIIHGSLNGTYGLAIMMIKGGSDLVVGVTGLAGFIALAVTNVILFFYDHARHHGLSNGDSRADSQEEGVFR
jgi:membrane protease YdiL (CAAX protease family)